MQIARVGCPAPLRLAERAQRVGRLARLAQDEDERPVVERGVPIAELAGVLDLDRQVRQPLDQVFPHQGRVPARPAGDEDDPADPPELTGRQVQATEARRPVGPAEPPPAGVADGVGLLADLLEHVVGMVAQLGGVGRPVDPVDPGRDRPAFAMTDLEVARGQADDLAVLEIGHPRSVRVRWPSRVAGEEMLPLPARRPGGCPAWRPTT